MAQYAIVTGDGARDYIDATRIADDRDDVAAVSPDDDDWQDELKNCTGVWVRGDVDDEVMDYLEARDGAAVIGDADTYDVLDFDPDQMIDDGIYDALGRATRRQKAEQLGDVLADRAEWAIGIHNKPDPDAIASALAIKHLVEEEYNGDARICHYEGVSRPENSALLNVLQLHNDLNPDRIYPEAYDGIALLDTASIDNIDCLPDDALPDVDVIIDHHDWSDYDNEDDHAVFDVRTGYGANASILAEYLEDITDEIDETVATALVHGIYTDTNGFSPQQTNDVDIDAFNVLSPHADGAALDKIMSASQSLETLRIKGKALSTFKPAGTTGVAYIGDVDDTDAMAVAADDLKTWDQGKTAIVAGITDEGYVEIKARSSDDTIDIGQALNDMFADELDEYANDEHVSAGAKAEEGGATLPLSAFDVPAELYNSEEDHEVEQFHKTLDLVLGKRFKDFGRGA